MPRPLATRPWVSANFATSWDGRISTRERTGVDFSSPFDNKRLLEIRSRADALIVSAVTAGADRMIMGMPDPKLRAARTARGQAPYPLRILLSNSGRISPDLPLFAKATSPIHIFSTERMPRRTRALLSSRAMLHLHPGERVDLAAMMTTLRREQGIRRLHCEGGGEILRSLLALDLLDELFLTLCARIFGGAGGPTLTGAPGAFLPRSTHCRLMAMQTVGDECFLRYRVQRPPVAT